MKKLIFSTLALLLTFYAGINCQAQSSFLPKNLGENVNSKTDEINPVLSPDGKTLYFIRVNHPDNNYGRYESQDVWFSELQNDGSWSAAQRFDNFINSSRYNAVIAVFNDGKTLLISGSYTKHRKWKSSGMSLVTKSGDEWSNAEAYDIAGFKRFAKGRAFNACISNDGQYMILAASKRSNGKKLNLYYSVNESGYWSKPKSLGESINTSYSEEAPFLSANNEMLYFTSNRNGSYDIYKSKRLGSSWDEWSEPVRLSDTINSTGYESYFKIQKQGNMAFFVTNKGSYGGTDIVKVKLAEDNPFIIVKGKIINSKTDLPLKGKTGYTITANGQKYDSLTINYDSATYRIKLPFKQKHNLKAEVTNYTSTPTEVDATQITEYKEINQDLYVKPIPYVLLQGRLLQKNDSTSIPPSVVAKIIINGLPRDSATIDPATATYSIRVLFGKKYTLKYSALGYKPITDTLNLTAVSEYKIVTKDLYGIKDVAVAPVVTKVVAGASIEGKVFDKKTGKPFSSAVPFSIQIDKLPDVQATINSATAEFKITVPLGQSYVINAKADKYYPVFETIDLTKEKTNIKVLKDLVLAPIEVGQAVRMNNIFFETGKSILKPTSFPELDKFATFLTNNANIKIEIDGHTDNVGKPDKNMTLSRWRARSVKLYLEQKGVDPSRITFNGFGSTKPVANNKTPKGKALNRRVEFVIKDIQ